MKIFSKWLADTVELTFNVSEHRPKHIVYAMQTVFEEGTVVIIMHVPRMPPLRCSCTVISAQLPTKKVRPHAAV